MGGLLDKFGVFGFTLTRGVWGAGPPTAGGRNLKKFDLQNALERIRKAQIQGNLSIESSDL